MGRSDFDLLTDDEIRSSLFVGAQRLAVRLAPRIIDNVPKFDFIALEDFCMRRLAEMHGLTELLPKAEAHDE